MLEQSLWLGGRCRRRGSRLHQRAATEHAAQSVMFPNPPNRSLGVASMV